MCGETGAALAGLLLLAANLALLVASVCVCAVSVWWASSPRSLYVLAVTIGSPTLESLVSSELSAWSCACVCVACACVCAVAALGLHGALSRAPALLGIYGMLMILLLLLESAVFFYYTSDLVQFVVALYLLVRTDIVMSSRDINFLDQEYQKGVRERDGALSHVVRLAFSCCDYNITEESETVAPWSCCLPPTHNCTSESVLTRTCSSSVSSWLARHQTAVYCSLAAAHLSLWASGLLRR